MKKLFVFAILVTIVASTVNAVVAEGINEIVGEWKFESPRAPFGYTAGIIVFSEKEGNLAGEVEFEDGYKIQLKKVKYTGNVISCELYIEYEHISVEAKVEGKKLAGTVETLDGELEITAEKVK